MDIYYIHPITGEFLGAGKADESPLEVGKYLIPTNAMLSAPPDTGYHQVAVAENNLWSVVADYRGTVYYLADGSRHEVSVIGVVPPIDLSSTPPPPSPEQQRADLLLLIDSERGRRWRSGFPLLIDGVTRWFHSDEFSLTQHLGLKDKARDLITAGGVMSDNITIGGQPVVWSTMDGSEVTITAQVAFDLVAAGGVQQALVFAASQAHRAALSASADPALYDVAAGWPAVFGE